MLGLLPRMAALDALQAVERGSFSDVALTNSLRRYSITDLDMSLVTELTYGAIRQRQLLDCWIDFLGKQPARKQQPLIRWLLHIGLYQILCMDRIPYSAAVNTSVELAKRRNLSRLAPVVNAVLRSAIRSKEKGEVLPLPKTTAEKLALQESLPIWLVKDLICWRGEEAARRFGSAANRIPTLDLRVNILRTTQQKMHSLFLDSGIHSSLIAESNSGVQIVNSGDLRNLPGYKEGLWCVQDRSAQLVASYLDPKPGENVLDACAAPGGKTTHLAELMQDKGELWAVDKSTRRLQRVVENASRLGICSIKTLVSDAALLTKLKPEWKGKFHRILIDAPCSGLGTLARNPDARWRIKKDQIKGLVCLQRRLLDELLPLLAPSGRLVYSTCTVHPDENSEQIKDFLQRNPQLSLIKERQIWPDKDEIGDGFYVASLENN